MDQMFYIVSSPMRLNYEASLKHKRIETDGGFVLYDKWGDGVQPMGSPMDFGDGYTLSGFGSGFRSYYGRDDGYS